MSSVLCLNFYYCVGLSLSNEFWVIKSQFHLGLQWCTANQLGLSLLAFLTITRVLTADGETSKFNNNNE